MSETLCDVKTSEFLVDINNQLLFCTDNVTLSYYNGINNSDVLSRLPGKMLFSSRMMM